MSDCRKCAEFDWCEENEDCGLFKPKPQTNADRIRAMSDEELAILLNNHGEIGCSIMGKWQSGMCEKPCVDCWLDWLQQEVKD